MKYKTLEEQDIKTLEQEHSGDNEYFDVKLETLRKIGDW